MRGEMEGREGGEGRWTQCIPNRAVSTRNNVYIVNNELCIDSGESR